MFRLKYSEILGEPDKFSREFIGNPVDEFSETFDRFANWYAIKVLIVDDELHKRPLKPKTDRVCRFCKATYSETERFISSAHLLPSLIGNENLFSDFECDKCNNLFAKYENSLANFLGVSRTMNMKNVVAGSLKFKSPDETFIVQKDKEAEAPKLIIESHEEGNDHFSLDTEEKKVTFHTKRYPYNPHKVWKAFLKMSLSVLPQQYVEDYELAFAILRSNEKNEEKNNPLHKVNMYVHPGPSFPSPMAILFERRNKSDLVPMHIACIMFYNYTYQIVLPFSKQDKELYNGHTVITFPVMPPFIDKHFAAKFGIPQGHVLNFNLDEVKKNEKHDVTYSFDSFTDTRFQT